VRFDMHMRRDEWLAVTGLAAILAALFLMTGCASRGPNMEAIYKMLQEQPRTFSPVKITGANELVLRGEDMTIELEAPLEPIQLWPQQPDAVRGVMDGLSRIATVGVTGYIGGELAQQPRVVQQPAPTIVRPEVVRVGAP
jgi:hypothetical protein